MKGDGGLNLTPIVTFNTFRPGIGAAILQSMVLGSSVSRKLALKQGLADYYQNIQVKGVGILEFNKLDYAEKIGYETSLPVIRKWIAQRNN